MTGNKASTIFDKFAKDNKIKWVSLRFSDLRGKEHHISLPTDKVNEQFFEDGKAFDGSSIVSWKPINNSDMLMMPDINTLTIDPFREEKTAIIRCNILEPETREDYARDPRGVALRAEKYLRKSGIGANAIFSCEPEFFIFDEARWGVEMSGCFCEIDSAEASWNSAAEYEEGNLGYHVDVKGGYMPVSPIDSLVDIRATIAAAINTMGLEAEVHHHEVGTAGQCEIGFGANTMCTKADEIMTFKYCVRNVAASYHKSATFMPKPLVGDNGNGMHCHQSIVDKNNKNIFAGDKYGNLSQEALWYIGGILKHARTINIFTNPSTNSYKRLVPGYEAPTILAYSAKNRSTAIRIPYAATDKERRIEARFPDASGSPYLALSAQLLAGLDGIKNKIDPGDHVEKDLYDISPNESWTYKQLCTNLAHAVKCLHNEDHSFLTQNGVFSEDLISAYIDLRTEEAHRTGTTTHPVEFEMYYSL